MAKHDLLQVLTGDRQMQPESREHVWRCTSSCCGWYEATGGAGLLLGLCGGKLGVAHHCPELLN